MRTLVSFSLIFLLACLPAKATLVPRLDLQGLVDNSDLIVVGIVSYVRNGERTARNVDGHIVEGFSPTGDIEVEKVLKGVSASSKLEFGFFIPFEFNGYRGISRGQVGIFCLRHTPAGWKILDGYHPFVVAVRGAPVTNGSVLDKVTSELAYAISSPEASPQTKREAVESLGTLTSAGATSALEAAARSKEAIPRALAIAALLGRGMTEWIEPAARTLLSPHNGLDPYAVWRLSGAIEQVELMLKDPKPIPTLARLLRVPDVTVRRAGAAALRETRDVAAIGPLTEALRDSDRDVQYQAVIGLAEITGAPSEWSPATDGFKQDPDRYLKHWREWAKSRNSPPVS